MFKFEPNDIWETYDSNVQAYRGNFFSTQSILLAVVAIILDKNNILTILISIIGLIQLWYIWFRVITTRIRIVDYHKYGMNKIFNKKGDFSPSKIMSGNYLREDAYANDKTIRQKVNKKMSALWERKNKRGQELKFRNFRMTRVKLDIIIPVSITLIWTFFIVNSVLSFYSMLQ